jgi:hypothetical protein
VRPTALFVDEPRASLAWTLLDATMNRCWNLRVPMLFSRTHRALRSDAPRAWLALVAVASSFVVAVTVWSLCATVPMVEVGERARIVASSMEAAPAHAWLDAEFAPPAGAQLRPGQPARLRLASSPSLADRVIPGRIDEIGRSPRLEAEAPVALRVKFLPATAGSRLAIGTGGTLEVEVDRLHPADLILRWAVGR